MPNNCHNIIATEYLSPCGKLILGTTGGKLCLCDWVGSPHNKAVMQRVATALNATFKEGFSPLIEQAKQQLEEYFAGERRSFSIETATAGTEFQNAVWQQLLEIPYGSTISYSRLAQLIGRPMATRAIANAVGSNAISIFIPCHRIVGISGNLTGYAGGLQAKQMLLTIESL